MSELTVADYAAMSSAAKILMGRYRGHVEYDDVWQELALWLYENYHKAERWRAELEPEHAERTLTKALRNAGERYCREQRKHQLGYDPADDEFYYSIPMIADLLCLHFDPEYRIPSANDPERVKVSAPAGDGMNLPTMVADVGRAYNTLPRHDKKLLAKVYGKGQDQGDEIAALSVAWDVSYSAAYSRVRRVVGRVRAALGGANPYVEVK